MIDNVTRDALKELRNQPADFALSLYLPTVVAGPETQQNRIRLKNLLQQADKELAELDLRRPQIDALLAPGYALVDDSMFLAHQANGLAVFLAEDFCRSFRLPSAPVELMVCSDRFHLKPLFPTVMGDGRFLILVIARGGLQLFEATRDHIEPLEAEQLPKDLADALKFDDPEAQLQFHTRAPAHGGGPRDAMFHGQGGGADEDKSLLLRYFQRVDKALAELLRDETAPLVLAGVDYLHPIYRDANSYPHLHEQGLIGNMEAVSPRDLHQQAWDLMAPQFDAERRRAQDEFAELSATERVSDRIDDILVAAADGRVQTVFVAAERALWGNFRRTTDDGKPEVTKRADGQRELGDGDLLDEAATLAFVNGASVYVVPEEQLPRFGDGHPARGSQTSAIRAVYRY